MKYKFIIIFVFSLLLVSCSLEANEESIYTGTIESNNVNLSTELGGKIVNIIVKDGEKIEKGDKIAEIDTTDLKIKLKKARSVLKAAEAKLEEIIEGARGEEIKSARANMKNIEMQLEGAKKNYEYRLKNFNDMNELFKNSAASQQQIEDAKALLDSDEAKVKSLERQLEASKAKLDLLMNGATKQKIKIIEAEVEIAKAEIELLEEQISKGEILAPISGIIEKTYYDIGEIIQIGGNIGRIIDTEDLWVKIYVPEKELHKIDLNQEIDLSVDYNNEIIRGRVIYFSPEAEFTPKNVESKENKEEMVFEIKIKILDPKVSLKPGMLIDVELEGDR